ncbi:MAG: hypothetical protein B6D61_05705 [Bacteroidetes bacterium 4484_249]|nr:MAG: hypothetical protein B6D61_05705 [Bacteroidetes bacterium 4484_249]
MRNTLISFTVPENLLVSLNKNREEFTKESRLYIAIQLFKDNKITSGQGAEIAGIDKYEFILQLEKSGIDFINYDPSELDEELKSLRQ